jgi:hypothetical protein
MIINDLEPSLLDLPVSSTEAHLDLETVTADDDKSADCATDMTVIFCPLGCDERDARSRKFCFWSRIEYSYRRI